MTKSSVGKYDNCGHINNQGKRMVRHYCPVCNKNSSVIRKKDYLNQEWKYDEKRNQWVQYYTNPLRQGNGYLIKVSDKELKRIVKNDRARMRYI